MKRIDLSESLYFLIDWGYTCEEYYCSVHLNPINIKTKTLLGGTSEFMDFEDEFLALRNNAILGNEIRRIQKVINYEFFDDRPGLQFIPNSEVHG